MIHVIDWRTYILIYRVTQDLKEKEASKASEAARVTTEDPVYQEQMEGQQKKEKRVKKALLLMVTFFCQNMFLLLCFFLHRMPNA